MLYLHFYKYCADFLISLFAIIILMPLFLIIGILIKFDSKGPVFFRQERLGKDGKIFEIFKFRSMRNEIYDEENDIENYYNNPRITKVGTFIRKTSIDEIPQIINVLRGEMSIIGPRPPLTYYPKKYEEYTEFEKKRFIVRPGMSGLAQVRGRNVDDWNINIPIDIEYVEKISFLYDTKIFIVSFFLFFSNKNIFKI